MQLSNRRYERMNISEIILEIIVGRLVLGLPNEDLVKINKMIVESLKEKKNKAYNKEIRKRNDEKDESKQD